MPIYREEVGQTTNDGQRETFHYTLHSISRQSLDYTYGLFYVVIVQLNARFILFGSNRPNG